jgi:hypothetical protein
MDWGTTSFARLVRKICLADCSWVAEVALRFRKAIPIGFRSFKMQYYNVSMMEVMKAVKPVTMM